MKKNNKAKNWLYWFSLALAIILIYKLLDNFTQIGEFLSNLIGILMPFAMGILIAYILYIPCKKIEEVYKKTKLKFLKKRARGFSIFTIYVIIALILFILINVILPPIIVSITDLVSNLPNYYTSITNYINNLPDDSFLVKINAQEIINKLQEIDFGKYLSIESITGYVKGVISVASGIFDVFVTIIISIYTLSEKERIINFLRKATSSLLKEEAYGVISRYFERTNSIFFNFISGQFIDAIIVGVVTTIAMLFIGVKYATLLGFLIGLFNLIPFFGAIVAVGIAIFITICTGGFAKAIWLAIIVIALQQIDANIINPKIMSDKLKISPILVIFSVAFAGAYFGILGMFLAVPCITMLKLIISDYLDYKEEKKKFIKQNEYN